VVPAVDRVGRRQRPRHGAGVRDVRLALPEGAGRQGAVGLVDVGERRDPYVGRGHRPPAVEVERGTGGLDVVDGQQGSRAGLVRRDLDPLEQVGGELRGPGQLHPRRLGGLVGHELAVLDHREAAGVHAEPGGQDAEVVRGGVPDDAQAVVGRADLGRLRLTERVGVGGEGRRETEGRPRQ